MHHCDIAIYAHCHDIPTGWLGHVFSLALSVNCKREEGGDILVDWCI